MLKLFYAPNTIAAATAIALHEAGLPFEPVRLDFTAAEQTKLDYLRINPKGRVPALVTEQGILTETGALLDYVAALAPDARLLPQDSFEAAQVRSLVHYLASTMHVNHAHKMRGHRWTDDPQAQAAMVAKVPQTMTASTQFMEDHITGPLLFGDHPTIADCHFYTISRWLEGDGVDTSAFPRLTRLMDTMTARPSVQTCVAQGILT